MKKNEKLPINKIICGDCLEVLKTFSENSIDTIITSPPYWGLRDYGEETKVKWQDGWFGQLGLEPTLDFYLEHLLQIMRELKRVLKKSGVMFINFGTSYSNGKAKIVIKEWYD